MAAPMQGLDMDILTADGIVEESALPQRHVSSAQ